jgi:hypothetical protein
MLAVGCGPSHTGTMAVGAGGAAGAAGSTGKAGSGSPGGSTGGPATGGQGGKPSLPPDDEVPPAQALSKLDLLLMVDNSRNTLAKSELLADAVAQLLDPGPDPAAFADIHVGVITSSLGSHGADGARDVCVTPDDNDHAHLLASVRPGLPNADKLGFLAWQEGTATSPQQLIDGVTATIQAAGDQGCGYEASLESWYRFLVDPEPPLNVVKDPNGLTTAPQGVDDTILAQRKAFLRPDSVLAIVVLSDENDCSIVDEGYGWLISSTMPMYRSTSQCLANPNDKCCQSCGEAQAVAGCPAISSDAECAKGQTLTVNGEDDLNLRCWDQKRRFGFDLLYPISRYTEALTRQFQVNRQGQAVRNPIFDGTAVRRHPSQVIYTGIVGVPWQDVVDQASLSGAGYTLLSAAELTRQGRWDVMLGDPSASPPVRPTDPFMVETPEDRSALAIPQAHPLVPTAALVPSTSMDPLANPMNGHENANVGNRQLQFACIFPMATPLTCDSVAFESNQSCLCFAEDAPYNSALCQTPAGGAPTTTQYFSDAFPGIRHLMLQRSLGDVAITASVCPKSSIDQGPTFGYRPVMTTLAARIQQALTP